AASDAVTAPRPAPWWRTRRDALLALAEQGTPAYVYDRASLLAAARALRGLGSVERVFYSLKANPFAGVLRVFEAEGLGFECVSPGELAHLFGTFPGLDPQRVLFTPNFAPREEYADALARGVHVTVDNLWVLEEWPETFRGKDVFLRLDPGHGRGHHRH